MPWSYTRPGFADGRDVSPRSACRCRAHAGPTQLVASLRPNDHPGRVRAGTVGYVAAGRWLRPFVTGLARLDRDGSVTLPSVATNGTHSPA